MVLEILLQFDSGRPIFGVRFPGLTAQVFSKGAEKEVCFTPLIEPFNVLPQLHNFADRLPCCMKEYLGLSAFRGVTGAQVKVEIKHISRVEVSDINASFLSYNPSDKHVINPEVPRM